MVLILIALLKWTVVFVLRSEANHIVWNFPAAVKNKVCHAVVE